MASQLPRGKEGSGPEGTLVAEDQETAENESASNLPKEQEESGQEDAAEFNFTDDFLPENDGKGCSKECQRKAQKREAQYHYARTKEAADEHDCMLNISQGELLRE